MATIAENGLFPPIIDAYLPALLKSDVIQNGIVVPFNLNYNDAETIKAVHVTITRQSNYHSAFKSADFPRGVYVQSVDFPAGSKNVSITIPAEVFQTSELGYNEYYKMQVRISTEEVPEITTPTDRSNYLTSDEYLATFSEWSTVCLLRFISDQNFNILLNNNIASDAVIDTSNLQIICNHLNEDINDTEYLYSCKFNFYTVKTVEEEEVATLIFTSPEILTNRETPNQINYRVPYLFQSGNYRVTLYYQTSNLYANSIDYNFTIDYDSTSWGNQNVISEVIGVDTVIGKVNISFTPYAEGVTVPAGSQIIIRRGTDEDNFTYFDTIYTKTLTEPLTDIKNPLSFNDFTIESGILYKYEITYISPVEISGHKNFTIIEGPAISVFDHAFLTGEGTQLCVKFNPQINSFKVNVGDSTVTTYGGKYPYITRNGNMYYRTFTLNGLIAYEMDAEHQFATRSGMYGEWISIYGTYFVNHYINANNDRITQRKFRELVMNYLYDDVPKLFRSTPEGNILVRLTDVNLTPKNELGRMIYEFSCTATEIGEPSVENCKLYKIQDYGD